MASAHTTVQEHVGHLTRHDPFGYDQKQFYVASVFGSSSIYCIDCGTTAEKGTVRCLYHYSQERLVVCSLATAKGVHTSGGKL